MRRWWLPASEHDLALLKVEASDLATVAWRAEPVVPGTLVAAVAPGGDAIGIGVISAEARAVADPYQRKGWRAFWASSCPMRRGRSPLSDCMKARPAAKAGLKVGDQIQSIDGAAMQSRDQIISTVRGHAPGDKLVIVLQRDAEQLTKEVVVAKPPMQGPEDQWGGGPFSVASRWFSSRAAPRHGDLPRTVRRSARRHGRQGRGSQHRPGAAGDDLRHTRRDRPAIRRHGQIARAEGPPRRKRRAMV